MSEPKILHAIHKLEKNGFYGNSTNLGDIRTNPTCLDQIFENGIYVFDGGATSPADTNGTYKWNLDVRACEDHSVVKQIAERMISGYNRIEYYRDYSSSTKEWTTFIESTSKSATIYSANLSVDSWTSEGDYYIQTLEISDIGLAVSGRGENEYILTISPSTANYSEYISKGIICYNFNSGIFSFRCTELPVQDMSILIALQLV